MSDNEDRPIRKDESFIDSLTSFFGFGGEEPKPDEDASDHSDSTATRRQREEDDAKGKKKKGKGKGKGKKRKSEGDGGEDGDAPLGRRKSVWDSMREIVVGEEEGAGDEDEDGSEESEGPPPYTNHVLVTGAEGYVAGWVIKELLERGMHVVGTVRTLRNKAKHQHLFNLVPELQEENPDVLELVEADLMRPMSFDRAIAKCEYVIHIATPFKLGVRDAKIGLLNPAVQGTLNVLRGVAKCEHIKRVVVTSCAVAMMGKPRDGKEYSEADWNTEATIDSYPYSLAKTEAEKQAYDFVKKLPTGNKISLVTLCPSFVVGPLLAGDTGTLNTSLRVMQDVMKGLVPFVPRMGLPLVDVRDVARAHVQAAFNPDANGRYAIHCDTMWFRDIVAVLKDNYKRGSFPPKEKSKFFVRRNEVFIRNMPFQYIRPWLGKFPTVTNRKSRKDLGLEYKPIEKSLIDMCESFEKWNI